MLSSYSVSSLGAFEECPRKFKFEKIEKPPVTERVAAHIYMGQVIHMALARLYETASHGKLVPLAEILGLHDAEWEKPARGGIVCLDESMTVDDYIATGRETLSKYYNKYQPFSGGTLLALERPLPLVLDGTPFRFNTKIDRLWKRPDGGIEIWDYKTGKELPRKTDVRFRRQMGLYHLAVKQNWPQFEKITVIQHALRQDEIISETFSPDELDEIAETFKLRVFETLSAEKTDDFPTKEGPHCRWCDYLSICPAKVHKRFIEGEESSIGEDKAAAAELASQLADRYLAAAAQAHSADEEKERLRAEVVEAARELGVSKLAGTTGEVSVKLKVVEEFPAKSVDPAAFGELSSLVREAGLETMFTLDYRALTKLYTQRRIPEELLKKFESFLVKKDRSEVRVPRRKRDDDDSGEDTPDN
jgi:hypothetical protein